MAWMKPRKYKMGDKRRILEREPRTSLFLYEKEREGGLAVVVVNRGLGDKLTGVHFFTEKNKNKIGVHLHFQSNKRKRDDNAGSGSWVNTQYGLHSGLTKWVLLYKWFDQQLMWGPVQLA